MIIVLIIFFIDRYSKVQILNNFSDNSTYFINNFLNLNLVWNTGIGFGLLSFEGNLIYHLITALIFGVIFYLIYLISILDSIQKIWLSIILGGALGNLYDRCVFFAVPDFIDLHYNSFHWFTFNIADIFITVGIILFLIFDIILKKNETY